MSLLRKLLFASLIVLAVLLAIVFAYSNPGTIALDIGFMRLESVSIAVAFAVTLAVGWVFGIASALIALLRLATERQKLRRDLRFAEAELSNLRSLPMHDAH